MNFSDCIKISGNAKFSYDNNYLAIQMHKSIIIYEKKKLKKIYQIPFQNEILFFEWSPDSSLLLIKEKNSSIVQIRNLDNTEWEGRIIDEINGIKYATWFNNSKYLITISDSFLKMNFYSLSSKIILTIKEIIFNDERCICYSSSKNFFAIPIVLLKEGDYLQIYKSENFHLEQFFPLNTYKIKKIMFVNHDLNILIWDRGIGENLILIYSLCGKLIKEIKPCFISLEILSIKQSFNQEFLSIGTKEESIKIYNIKKWDLKEINFDNYKGNAKYIYKEEEDSNYENNISKNKKRKKTKIINLRNYENINLYKINNSGVKKIEWNFNSKYIAFNDESHPKILFIWKIGFEINLNSILIFLHNIKDFKWSPSNNQLIILTEFPYYYIFSTLNGLNIGNHILDFIPYFIKWDYEGYECLIFDKNKNNLIVIFPDEKLFLSSK